MCEGSFIYTGLYTEENMGGQMKHYYKKDRNAKRLLVISHGIGGGGAQKVTAMLSNGFSDRGYQVRIVTTSPSESIYEIYAGSCTAENIIYAYTVPHSGNSKKHIRF